MPGRKCQAGSESYRYSINGQEKEFELNENITTAEFWEYDSRIVRRWNVDPIVKMDESPYFCFGGNPIGLPDPDGLDVKYEKGNDVKDKEHRGMKFRIFLLRVYSKSFRKMYRDMKNADQTFTFRSETSTNGYFGEYVPSSNTIKIDVRQDGSQLDMSKKDFQMKSLQKIGHETGHAWRNLMGLDGLAPVQKTIPLPTLSILDKPEDTKRKWAEYYKKCEIEDLRYKTALASRDEIVETGGMEVENLVASELLRHSMFKKTSYIKNNYGSKLVVTVALRAPQRIYYATEEDQTGGGYNAFKNFSKDFFMHPQNIHKMYKVTPIKKQ
jgi:hypothetical protein